jgi:predicted 3-demethylubiquinone-9 3-methyltransferase (glyoxalase superfamily)
MQKITPFLWFDNEAEEAANYYVSIFRNSKILSVARYNDAGPGSKGSVMLVKFQIEGQEFQALNGGPLYHFTEAISLYVNCATQQEVDEIWDKIIAGGGKAIQCGWIKDKYGLCWQIIPTALAQCIGDKDPARAARAMQAMLKMQKIDIRALEDAANGVNAQ